MKKIHELDLDLIKNNNLFLSDDEVDLSTVNFLTDEKIEACAKIFWSLLPFPDEFLIKKDESSLR